MNQRKPKDHIGRPVGVGDFIRILALRSSVLARLPEDERQRVASMVGEVFAVYEVDEFGQPWVMKEWSDGDGHIQTHSIALDTNEMERI